MLIWNIILFLIKVVSLEIMLLYHKLLFADRSSIEYEPSNMIVGGNSSISSVPIDTSWSTTVESTIAGIIPA